MFRACEINNKHGYHSKDHNQDNIPNDNNSTPTDNHNSIPTDNNGSSFGIDKIPDLYPIAPLGDNDFQSDIEKIPDLCPINSFGDNISHNDQICISDEVNMQFTNDNDQTSMYIYLVRNYM